MSAIPVRAFQSWAEFKATIVSDLFQSLPFQRSVFIFRGQSNPAWKLSPTFDRTFGKLPKEKRRIVSEDLLRTFRKDLERLELPEKVRDDDSLLLALGQHHGLPTRLLDWTESPYIAAFFAFNNTVLLGDYDSSMAIWGLDTRNPIWSEEYGVQVVEVPTFGNIRIRNQSGKFTLSKTPFDCLEDYVKAHSDEGVPLRKYLIPGSESRHALSDLDAMGINQSSVYPEIVGSAQLAVFRAVVSNGITLD
ncbi:MAG TPA: FRG domain-containing protein [Thermoanaerobaculia bacterium]|nr:FRG domain-containing protein [Thermoanaerobaculia bacterium]